MVLARDAGAILGREARSRGFNVVLGGRMNLARDPRHGRDFEYFSEPLLSALMAAETVKGTQSEGVIGMLKHVSLNSHETNKWFLDAQSIPRRIANPSCWCSRSASSLPSRADVRLQQVNGAYACGNDPILNGVIKLARFDDKAGQWRITTGTYRVTLGKSAGRPGAQGGGAADSASVSGSDDMSTGKTGGHDGAAPNEPYTSSTFPVARS
jgi:hypothetical protein